MDFCDEIIVLDNMSTDNTYQVVEKMTKKYPSTKLQKIAKGNKSQSIISHYAGTPTWLFKVDGDEIYDPVGLQEVRKRVMTGEYQKYWRLEGNSINCTELDLQKKTAVGYSSPPSKVAPFLYNFSVIDSWEEENEQRLHGENIVFKDGFGKNNRFLFFEKYDWENSPFRCLHICFIRRSSLEEGTKNARLNARENSYFFPKALNFLRNLLKGNLSFGSKYKQAAYKRGGLCSTRIDAFFD